MKTYILSIILSILLVIGYIRCIFKFVNCNFDPIDKCEIVYGVGLLTGLGGIIGYINIEDK